jgi:hypothetical protein
MSMAVNEMIEEEVRLVSETKAVSQSKGVSTMSCLMLQQQSQVWSEW